MGVPSLTVLLEEIRTNGHWIGTLFGAAYAALYARFASQWGYLADVYNQIKAAEARASQDDTSAAKIIAEWKAGFIEDAEHLHLATKSQFASIIIAWSKQTGVKEAYEAHTIGGDARFSALMGKVIRAQAMNAEKYAIGEISRKVCASATRLASSSNASGQYR